MNTMFVGIQDYTQINIVTVARTKTIVVDAKKGDSKCLKIGQEIKPQHLRH